VAAGNPPVKKKKKRCDICWSKTKKQRGQPLKNQAKGGVQEVGQWGFLRATALWGAAGGAKNEGPWATP